MSEGTPPLDASRPPSSNGGLRGKLTAFRANAAANGKVVFEKTRAAAASGAKAVAERTRTVSSSAADSIRHATQPLRKPPSAVDVLPSSGGEEGVAPPSFSISHGAGPVESPPDVDLHLAEDHDVDVSAGAAVEQGEVETGEHYDDSYQLEGVNIEPAAAHEALPGHGVEGETPRRRLSAAADVAKATAQRAAKAASTTARHVSQQIATAAAAARPKISHAVIGVKESAGSAMHNIYDAASKTATKIKSSESVHTLNENRHAAAVRIKEVVTPIVSSAARLMESAAREAQQRATNFNLRHRERGVSGGGEGIAEPASAVAAAAATDVAALAETIAISETPIDTSASSPVYAGTATVDAAAAVSSAASASNLFDAVEAPAHPTAAADATTTAAATDAFDPFPVSTPATAVVAVAAAPVTTGAFDLLPVSAQLESQHVSQHSQHVITDDDASETATAASFETVSVSELASPIPGAAADPLAHAVAVIPATTAAEVANTLVGEDVVMY